MPQLPIDPSERIAVRARNTSFSNAVLAAISNRTSIGYRKYIEDFFRTDSNSKPMAVAAKPSDTKRSGPAAAHPHPHMLHGGSPGVESARDDEPFIVFGDAGQACRTAAAVRSTPTHNAGKRAQRFNASTSVHAFWLS